MTDTNGLIYMRARYYSPELRRFVNADIIPGEISQAVTLNRYAYANGNPVSNVDPFGLAAWSNWLKVGIGAVVIAGLAVDTAGDVWDATTDFVEDAGAPFPISLFRRERP